jgi:hypothetical protein
MSQCTLWTPHVLGNEPAYIEIISMRSFFDWKLADGLAWGAHFGETICMRSWRSRRTDDLARLHGAPREALADIGLGRSSTRSTQLLRVSLVPTCQGAAGGGAC